MSALKKIAKSHTILDGAITTWFLPITTVRQNILVDDAIAYFGFKSDNWSAEASPMQFLFVHIEGCIVDIEFADKSDDHEIEIECIKQYWENRVDGNIETNWLWFTNGMTQGAALALWTGYEKTRRNHIPKVDTSALDIPPPDPDTPENQKKTKRGRRSTKKK